MTVWSELQPKRSPLISETHVVATERAMHALDAREGDAAKCADTGAVFALGWQELNASRAPDPSCPVCGRRMLALLTFERGPVGWVCVSEHPNPLDDFLPGRTPADEFIAEWERLGTSAETAERIDAFFSGANPEPNPPGPSGSPDSDTRRAEGPERVSGPGSRPSAGGTRGPGFLEVCVRDVLARAPWPLTAFEIAREVLKGHPNRWASRSIERKVSKLADRGVLREVDCEGLSPDHSPCWRYELGTAA